ncbi:hypothetical protein BEP19_06455 [Ammoniphilus oxalaticus]|uniref:Competence protein ComK n=1 Tax=Ammoniphilus oxalaticus TaxID=66863 RepID=A0A419SJC6_9BACL|nr:competence protein ComK [Ammoniphilus oxalaticus]RKD24046.1 hypothetical protein BEP19_06455 [Ammoniphilus oxalaticus]
MSSYGKSDLSDVFMMGREFMRQGLAIKPILTPGVGETTRLIMLDRSFEIGCTSQRFLKVICEAQFFEFQFLRKQAMKITGKKQLVPIPLANNIALFPLRPLHEGEAQPRNFLWIVHRSVQRIGDAEPANQLSKLTLTNGEDLVVPYRPAFIKQQVRDCYLLEYFFQQAHNCMKSSQHCPAHLDLVHSEEWRDPLLKIAEAIRNYP